MTMVSTHLLCLRHPTVSAKPLCFRLFRCNVRSSGQILLPRYLLNGLSNFNKTVREYSLAPTDDMVRF